MIFGKDSQDPHYHTGTSIIFDIFQSPKCHGAPQKSQAVTLYVKCNSRPRALSVNNSRAGEHGDCAHGS